MISTVPPLFEDERKQEADNYAQNMHNMQALLVSRLLEQTNKKKKGKKTKGKKTTSKSSIKKTNHIRSPIPPSVRANLRQQLLQRQQTRLASYAQPYVPQQEEKLQQAKDRVSAANNQLVNYQAAIQQQKEEARKSEAALKAAKAKTKEEEKRANDAERRNAELEKQQAAYEDARTRYQRAMHEGDMGELEMENTSLLSKVKMLEFAITDRKAQVKRNKMAHKNEVLQTEVDSLTAERDALDELLKSDAYSKSVDVQVELVKKQKELELQRDLKKKQVDQLISNHDLQIELLSMPSELTIQTLNKQYDNDTIYSSMIEGYINTQIANRKDRLFETEAKRKAWERSVQNRESAAADLARLKNEVAGASGPTDKQIATINEEIADLNIQLDDIKDRIENNKSIRSRYNKLISNRDQLRDDFIRENAKSMAYMNSTIPIVNAIPNVASMIGDQEVQLEEAKYEQEPFINRHKQLSTLKSRLSTTGNSVAIERGKLAALTEKKPRLTKKIKKALSSVASAEVALDQSKEFTKAHMDRKNATESKLIEESKLSTINSEDWLNKSRKITQMKIDTANAEENRQKQKALNDAVKKHTEDTTLSNFFQACADRSYNLDLHAHEVDGELLRSLNITSDEDQTAVLNSIEGLRKASSEFAIERTRVATEANNILNDLNLVGKYDGLVEKGELLDLRKPPETTREEFHVGVTAFRDFTNVPNAFNDIYHDVQLE